MVIIRKKSHEFRDGIPAWLHDKAALELIGRTIVDLGLVPAKTSTGELVAQCNGLRLPHLHYEDKIYILSKVQWAGFSSKMLTEFSKSLTATKTISFDHMQELTDTISAL